MGIPEITTVKVDALIRCVVTILTHKGIYTSYVPTKQEPRESCTSFSHPKVQNELFCKSLKLLEAAAQCVLGNRISMPNVNPFHFRMV